MTTLCFVDTETTGRSTDTHAARWQTTTTDQRATGREREQG